MVNAVKQIILLLDNQTRVNGEKKVAETFVDILKALDYCDKNSVTLSKFVIFKPE